MCDMSHEVSLILMLLLHYATQSHPANISANCHEDVLVECQGINSTKFTSVAWYKINKLEKVGILRMDEQGESVQHYNYSRSPKPRFGEEHSLVLPRVTPGDSGIYECEISADIGGQNRYLEVAITVQECVTLADTSTVMAALNTTQPELHCHSQAEALPIKWPVVGYTLVGITKIVLSLISIWVIKAHQRRSSRRQWHRW